jgi:hypothetical protein
MATSASNGSPRRESTVISPKRAAQAASNIKARIENIKGPMRMSLDPRRQVLTLYER